MLMTTLARWIVAVALWLAYGVMVGLVLAVAHPKTATMIFAGTGSLAYAALIAFLFKLK